MYTIGEFLNYGWSYVHRFCLENGGFTSYRVRRVIRYFPFGAVSSRRMLPLRSSCGAREARCGPVGRGLRRGMRRFEPIERFRTEIDALSTAFRCSLPPFADSFVLSAVFEGGVAHLRHQDALLKESRGAIFTLNLAVL